MRLFLFSTILFCMACSNTQSMLPKKLTAEKVIVDTNKLQTKLHEAKQFCKAKKWNTKYFILIDLSIHSGANRLFVYHQDSLIKSALVSHGCANFEWGKDQSKTSPIVSNTPDSHCSSVGKYRIGNRGKSAWGIGVNYTMHGLESSNSNAAKREIVLHGWDAIPNAEIIPNGVPEGWGCPAVSNQTMQYLDSILKHEKNVLMWVLE